MFAEIRMDFSQPGLDDSAAFLVPATAVILYILTVRDGVAPFMRGLWQSAPARIPLQSKHG